MKEPQLVQKSFPRAAPFVVLALLGLGIFWVARGQRSAPPEVIEPRAAEPARHESSTVPASVNKAPPRAAAKLDYAPDGVPYKPHVPSSAEPEGPMHPHPITEAHERIYRENHLVARLNDAMDIGDVAWLRKMLDTYRREYPEDPHALQEGYEVIADCLEHPGQASTEVARQYYAANKASTLRRYVRRHCFEAGR